MLKSDIIKDWVLSCSYGVFSIVPFSFRAQLAATGQTYPSNMADQMLCYLLVK